MTTPPLPHPPGHEPDGSRRGADRRAGDRGRGRDAGYDGWTPDAVAGVPAELDAIDALRADVARRAPAPSQPPVDLAERVLGRALARRPAGRPVGDWAAVPINPVEALQRMAADLAVVLDGLQPVDWDRPARTARAGWSVADVLAHLVAGERYLAALLGAGSWTPPPGTETDHVAMTEPTVEQLRRLSAASLRRVWDDASGRTLDAAGRALAEPGAAEVEVTFTGLLLRVSTVLVVRTFEVWTHTEDVRRAVGLPLESLDGDRLALMSNVAVRSLPFGLALAGRSRPGRTARVVLTGPGGGAWSQSMGLGEPPGDIDLILVTDVVDYCRLAAQRLTVGELTCHVEGDERLAADLLAGAAVFAA